MSAAPRKIRVVLAYDGTAYAGWQVQPRRPTVQAVVQDTLGSLHGCGPIPVRGSGRTDAGVHAVGQVADAVVRTRMDDAALLRGLDALLPEDVRPLSVRTVADDADARRDARSKTYVYLVDRGRPASPFLRRYAHHVERELDPGRMRDALRRVPGRHDWSGFTSSQCTVVDRVRTVTEATYDERGTLGVFRFVGEGFLTYMVRNIVGTVLSVGLGRLAPEVVDAMIETGDRSIGGATAPPRGLFLRRVVYDDDPGPEAPGWPLPGGC